MFQRFDNVIVDLATTDKKLNAIQFFIGGRETAFLLTVYQAVKFARHTMKFRIIEFESVDSTNDTAMGGLGSGEFHHGDIISARSQVAGRGQRGNRWVSPAGENLTFSLVIEPTHIPVCEQFAISEMAALAAAEAIRRTVGVQCNIKWPNDLYIGDRKVGGILIEHTMHSEMLSASIIGIGINVRQREFDPTLPNPTSLAVESAREVSPAELLESFCHCFSECYDLTFDSAERLHCDFMAHLWRRDGFHLYRIPEHPETVFAARIQSVDPHTGYLKLIHEQGLECEYWFKEVEAVL